MLAHAGRGRPRTPLSIILPRLILLSCVVLLLLARPVAASVGDRLPEFRECVEVCERENCGPDAAHQTPIPLHRRLLFWTCPAECDYTCQRIVTARREAAAPPQPVVQFHGKWPFYRLWGVQEPFSALFSVGNFLAHWNGLRTKVLRQIPASYPLRPYYVALACISLFSWTASAVFHTRDTRLTERLDSLGAGAAVMYGLYYTPVRIWRLDQTDPQQAGRNKELQLQQPMPVPAITTKRTVWRLWTAVCAITYTCHVLYLTLVKFDYGYNMTANVIWGVLSNAMWSWFSWHTYRRNRRPWAVWPGLVVAWVLVAMSLELLDFPPLWGSVDAHSLWHFATIFPTVIWYNFLVKDAQENTARFERLNA